MKYNSGFVLCATSNDEWGKEQALKYIKKHGLTKDQVSLIALADGIIVRVKTGQAVELKE